MPPSSHLDRTLRSGVRVAAALSLAALLAPAAARAADAPLRTIGIGANGNVTLALSPLAVSPDGTEVLTRYGGAGNGPAIRNVAAGTTTALLTGSESAAGASIDLRRVLVSGARRLDPVNDTDALTDLYVYDRTTGKSTLVSKDPATHTLGRASDETYLLNPRISGDGNVVQFTAEHVDRDLKLSTQTTTAIEMWRFDLAANRLTQVGDITSTGVLTQNQALDNAGQVAVSSGGVWVGTKHYPTPFPGTPDLADAWVSADGTSVAFSQYTTKQRQLTLLDTATGALTLVKVPDWLAKTTWQILGAANKNAGAILGTTLDRGAGPRFVVGSITKAGAVTQIGGDIKVTDSSQYQAITQNLQFVATGLHLAQLGTTPLPGAEPPTGAPNTNALSYVYLQDTYCSDGFFGPTWHRANVGNNAYPAGADTRTLVKSDWVVFDSASKRVINAFTLSGAGKSRELTVQRTGGYTATLKVYLSDGTTLNGSTSVAPHPIRPCEPLVF